MKINCDFVIKKIDDKTVFIPFGNKNFDLSKVITINDSAQTILEFLKDDHTICDTILEVSTKFECEPSDVEQDVKTFINILKENSLIDEN